MDRSCPGVRVQRDSVADRGERQPWLPNPLYVIGRDSGLRFNASTKPILQKLCPAVSIPFICIDSVNLVGPSLCLIEISCIESRSRCRLTLKTFGTVTVSLVDSPLAEMT